MDFTVETTYDAAAMKALARGLRKTLRKKRSRRSHIFGTLVVILGIVLMAARDCLDLKFWVTGAAVAAILMVFLFEDAINGHVALKRNLPGMDHGVTTFRQDGYHSETSLGNSTFSYDNVTALAQTKDHFLLIFGPSHGQVYAKAGLSGGDFGSLKALLEEKTGKTMETV